MKSDHSPGWEGFANYYCLPILIGFLAGGVLSLVQWAVRLVMP